MIDIRRKEASQERSRRTVETILSTTAQILSEEGSRKLTTNYLASRTGFSIGTIYQYFPDKVAIIMALLERQREENVHHIDALLSNKEDIGAEEKIRLIIRSLHHAFSMHRLPDQKLVRALIHAAAKHGLPSPSGYIAQAIINVWVTTDSRSNPLNPGETFVLTHMLIEVMRQAALRATPLLGSEEFEAAVLRMVMGFLEKK
ncbi:TetR/AcrR family transcriptional regulator (plasmid) [Erwinia pyri]|uniref:TetR/AcrR family transcriptional regulator n=1 Tax=Erwinia pyri TaxID=3062598 RepID=A0AA50DQ34_9GAMM|nr:TetR/AcrR family transcriptional regulator [Erwinia sp. DE2]WLS81073.1 TetR/AcrR family transcriptional regulator [Erwinia sp. DE2]